MGLFDTSLMSFYEQGSDRTRTDFDEFGGGEKIIFHIFWLQQINKTN